MTSSRRGSRYSRRIVGLTGAVLVAVLVFTAGWYYVAGRLERAVEAALAELGDDARAACRDAQVRGFPFRIGVFCDGVSYENPARAVAAEAGALRTAAQIYQPTRVVAELDGPARLALPGLPPLAVGWQSLRASARLARPLPERLSLAGSALTVATAGDGARLAGAAGGELHARPAGADLDLAVRLDGLALAGGVLDAALPPLDATATLRVADGAADAAALAGGLPGSLRGRSAVIEALTVRTADAGAGDAAATGLTLSGPVSLSPEGLLDAELSVTVDNPQALAALLARALPAQRQAIETALSGIAALGETPRIPVRIARGEVIVGFFTVGRIPPL